MKSIIPYIVILLAGIVIGLLCRPSEFIEVEKKATDTLVVRDTQIIEKPVEVEKKVKEIVYIAVHDTTHIRDSVFVPITLESKTYKGEDYTAVVSGYMANLDHIETYPKTTIVTEYINQSVTKRNHLAIGIEASYSTIPYIPIYFEYSYLLHKNVEVYGRVFRDLPRQCYGVGVGINYQLGW